MTFTGYRGFTWVASPPREVSPRAPRRRVPAPYQGPPAYPAPPRWGFPRLAWRSPTQVPGATVQRSQTRGRVRSASRTAVTMLAVTAAVALAGTGSEIWRYVVLLRSRNHLLSATVVAVSDTLTDVAGVLAIVFAVLAAVAAVSWLHRARMLAAERSGYAPARGDVQALLGPFVPGLNLVLPFSVLAELEHAALDRDRRERPRPTRLLLVWWAAWIVGAALFLATLVLDQFPGVQARADGVVLHAVLDASAVLVALVTAVVVHRMTALLAAPAGRAARFSYVLRVTGAPAPATRRPRPSAAPR